MRGNLLTNLEDVANLDDGITNLGNVHVDDKCGDISLGIQLQETSQAGLLSILDGLKKVASDDHNGANTFLLRRNLRIVDRLLDELLDVARLCNESCDEVSDGGTRRRV